MRDHSLTGTTLILLAVGMTEAALKYLDNTAGFEIGVGPSVVVEDAGKATTPTTTTARADVYAFIFGQKGLMAGLGLQASKITRTGL